VKKLIKIALPIFVLILSYFLFEPVVLYNFGRSSFPDLTKLNPKIESINSTSKKVDKILKNAYFKLQTPALSVAIGIDNKIKYSNTIGFADINNKILADSLTKFRIGSTSKAITSAGLGVLIENKRLNLTSIVKTYVSYASEELSEITLEQLASHTSGIRNYSNCLCFPIWEYYNNDQYNSVKESIDIFNNDPLLFTSGTAFSYSSYNYTLLSAIIEGATNKDFLIFMQESVFDPLDLKHTIADKQYLTSKNIAKFYTIENDNYKEAYKINNSHKWAGGGFLSTPTDLVKFGNAMLNNTLLDSTTTDLLFTPLKLKNGKVNKQNYAIGWRNNISKNVFKEKRKTRVIHHGGTALGSTALLILLPEYNTSVAITMNRNGKTPDLFKLAYELAELYILEKE
jgi:CubicO group peptidase (beta-lactamase class C family)